MSQELAASSTGRPWGRLGALLIACAVTLLGVARGLDPWVILCRATGAACIVGFAVAVTCTILTRLSKRNRNLNE
jgi:uncharacterized membrane protein